MSSPICQPLQPVSLDDKFRPALPPGTLYCLILFREPLFYPRGAKVATALSLLYKYQALLQLGLSVPNLTQLPRANISFVVGLR